MDQISKVRTKNGYITWNPEWICSINCSMDNPGKLTVNMKTHHYVNGIITILRVISIPNSKPVPGHLLYKFARICNVSKVPDSLCDGCYYHNRTSIETNQVNLCKDCLWKRHLFAVNVTNPVRSEDHMLRMLSTYLFKQLYEESYQCNAIIRTETNAIFFTTKIINPRYFIKYSNLLEQGTNSESCAYCNDVNEICTDCKRYIVHLSVPKFASIIPEVHLLVSEHLVNDITPILMEIFVNLVRSELCWS
jgi:hypothetical protein